MHFAKFEHLRRHWLSVSALTLLVACGSPSGTGNTPSGAQSPAPATGAATATQPAAAPAETPAQAPAAAPAPQAVQETTAESGDGGEQLRLASAAPAAGDAHWRFQEGQDFKVLTTAQGTSSSPDKIEVAEVFWYGCTHCYEFDPMLADWARKLPSDVSFVRVPVMWNPTHQMHGRMFYTAQALGKLDEMHTAIFREIHLNKKMLTSEEEIQDLFGKFGVSAADFQKTFRSFAVESQLKRAKELTQRYEVRGVPLLVVNGKYSTDAPGIKNRQDELAVATELIERERRR